MNRQQGFTLIELMVVS
ncbi:prepilin-type N-terminal cleavage/methylation domain-containing protein [Enterobacter cloacae]|nr:prepilin-type N-terminal cleavage/methylation domain-containing protein [Enterobacter asburiae]